MARRDALVLCYHRIAPGSRHGEVTSEALADAMEAYGRILQAEK